MTIMSHQVLRAAQMVGLRAGRETNDLTELDDLFRRAGFPVGSPNWTEAHRCAATAWACIVEHKTRELN